MAETMHRAFNGSPTYPSKLDPFQPAKPNPRFKRKDGFSKNNTKAVPPPFFNDNKRNSSCGKRKGDDNRSSPKGLRKSQTYDGEEFRLRGHQKDMRFDIRDMWIRGLTHPVEISEPILERKLLIALERVERLEHEVECLKKENRALTIQNLKNCNVEEERGKATFYNEYWFMCRQYTELQKRYFQRAMAIKENCKDAAVQCDIPLKETTQPPPRPQRLPQSHFSPTINQVNISALPPKVTISQSKNAPHQRRPPPQLYQTEQVTRFKDNISISPAKTLGGLSSVSNLSDEKLIQGHIMDMSSKKWLESFKEFSKEQPYYRASTLDATFVHSPGNLSFGSEIYDEPTLLDASPNAGHDSPSPLLKNLFISSQTQDIINY